MKYKIKILLLAVMIIVLTASCGSEPPSYNDKQEEFIDYSPYTNYPWAYTDYAYMYFDNVSRRLYGTDPDLSAPISVMCSNPNCDHRDDECPAYFGNAYTLLAWNNKLYYVEDTTPEPSTGYYSYELYRADPDGRNREFLREVKIDFPEYDKLYTDGTIGAGIYAKYLQLYDRTKMIGYRQIYLYSFEDNDIGPEIILSKQYDLNETEQLPFVKMWAKDGWLFYLEEEESVLYGYCVESGKTSVILENVSYVNSMVLRGNLLYCTVPDAEGKHITSININTGEIKEYESLRFEETDGLVFCSKYICNFPFGYENPNLEEHHEVEKDTCYLYDYEGNLVLSFPWMEFDDPYFYFMEGPDKLFFAKIDSHYKHRWDTICYIDTSAVEEGRAELVFPDLSE